MNADWDGSRANAVELQAVLARGVVRRDDFVAPLRTVAGFDVAFERDDTIIRAEAVLLDADTLGVLDRQVARMPARMAPVPDLLGLLALPALLQCLGQLAGMPGLMFVGGHGIAHPQRFGIASHFGVVAGLPSIGVAGEALVGTAATLHEIRGAHTPLRDHGEQVGWLLRSRVGAPPLVVSPGHRVSMTAAAQLVMRFSTSHRLPEPLRLLEGGEAEAAVSPALP